MSGWIRRNDPWALGAFALWMVILAAGYFPELTYVTLRKLAGVVTQDAWVNNPFIITVAFAAFVGVFTWRRALECNAAPETAEANGVQLAFLAFLAFAPVNPEDFLLAFEKADWTLIAVIWGTGLVKSGAWLYLVTVFFRYYLLHNYRVFAGLGSVFPSGRRKGEAGYEKPATVYDPSGE